jgi:hypothetical protein
MLFEPLGNPVQVRHRNNELSRERAVDERTYRATLGTEIDPAVAAPDAVAAGGVVGF